MTEREKEREKLIELLRNQNCPSPMICDKNCKYAHLESCYEDRTADHLLSNGVVCPPCKVGETTYLLLERLKGGYDIVESECVSIAENKYSKIFSMAFDCTEIDNTLEYRLEDFGRWVFLTKEEAEAKLKEVQG